MFVRFSQRSRASKQPEQEPHRTLIAQIVESRRRVDGKFQHRIVAHLGTCREPIDRVRHRLWFYERCNEVLDRLDLSADDRAKVAAQIAARIPPLTAEEEMAEVECQAAEIMSKFHPDRLTILVRAWDAASESEQFRFLDVLRQRQVI